MSTIDDLAQAVTRPLGKLGNLIDGAIETIIPVDLLGSAIGDTVEDISPQDETAGVVTDSLEEMVLSDLEEAGGLSSENVEVVLRWSAWRPPDYIQVQESGT